MSARKLFKPLLALILTLVLPGFALIKPVHAQSPTPNPQAAGSRPVGTVKAISGNSVTLATDAGAEITVTVQDSTRLIKTAPGQKDLTGATPIQLKDLQVGDRILVRGTPSEDSKSIAASSIIVMKKSDIEQKQANERADWQKRGVGGLVTAVDPASGTITISSAAVSGNKSVAIHTSKDTVIRRYAADSIKFDDAKLAKLDQIQAGDQVRARGDRSPDGSEVTAQEIVSGSFRNIAGTVISIDAAANTITVTDLKTKKPVTVKLTPDSQFRKLPAMMAQIIAARMSGANGASGATGAAPAGGNAAAGNAPANPSANSSPGSAAPGAKPGAGAGNGRAGGAQDFQQILNRVPAATLADLVKGDAVMIVATQGTGDGPVTAITMLSGVDAILAASPKGTQQMFLTPWNLEASGGGDAASQ
jgi:Domain of unknown function (DUF5666)